MPTKYLILASDNVKEKSGTKFGPRTSKTCVPLHTGTCNVNAVEVLNFIYIYLNFKFIMATIERQPATLNYLSTNERKTVATEKEMYVKRRRPKQDIARHGHELSLELGGRMTKGKAMPKTNAKSRQRR